MSEVQIENIVLDCNRLALENLSKGNAKACLHLLKRAQDLLNTPDFYEGKERLLVITYNNLGCYHKACQKYSFAMQAFQKAVDLRSDFVLDKQQAAEVHINICFIREIFAQFENLVVHSKRALELLSLSNGCKKGIIPLVYLYLGKGYLGLDNKKLSSLYLKQGLEISYKELGHSHPTTAELLKLYLSVSTSQLPEDPKPKLQSLSSKKSISSNTSHKKYIFEHTNLPTPDNFFRVSVDKQPKKPSPVKADKRLIDGIYFEEVISKPRVDRPCRHQHEVPSSAKSRRESSSTALNSSGRLTPEVSFRNGSAQSQRVTERGLPKIRASSSRPTNQSIDLQHSRMSKEQFEDFAPKPPKDAPASKKPPASARNSQYRKPSSDSLKSVLLSELTEPSKDHEEEWKAELQTKLKLFEDLKKAPKDSPVLQTKLKLLEDERKPQKDNPANHTKPKASKEPKKKKEWSVEKIKLIQRCWRGFKGRKEAKALRRSVAKVKAQRALEDLEELKKMARMENQEGLVSATKGRGSRKSFERTSLPVIIEARAEYSDEPVILIQKNVKMFLQRRKFRRVKLAAVKIQSFVRMSSVRELFVNILSAIVFIQRTWRLFRKRPAKTVLVN